MLLKSSGTFYGRLFFALDSWHCPWQDFPETYPGLDFFFSHKKKGMETEEGLAQNKTQLFFIHVLYLLVTEYLFSVFFILINHVWIFKKCHLFSRWYIYVA